MKIYKSNKMSESQMIQITQITQIVLISEIQLSVKICDSDNE
jgi:hypothetical protein